MGRRTVNAVKRKLANRQGATFVFAMVTLLILTLFSAELMQEASTALHNSMLLRKSEKAYASISSAARLIQDSLKAAPDMTFAEREGTGWTWESLSKSDNQLVQNVLIAALNGADPIELVWRVTSDGWPELEDAFTDAPLTVTAEYATEKALADFVSDDSPCKPTVTIRFCHPDYKMTMRITARDVEAITDADNVLKGYVVTFAENGELDIALSLGAS